MLTLNKAHLWVECCWEWRAGGLQQSLKEGAAARAGKERLVETGRRNQD